MHVRHPFQTRETSVEIYPTFPCLKSHTGDNLRRVAMSLGGIGIVTVSLGGCGTRQNEFEVMADVMGSIIRSTGRSTPVAITCKSPR